MRSNMRRNEIIQPHMKALFLESVRQKANLKSLKPGEQPDNKI